MQRSVVRPFISLLFVSLAILAGSSLARPTASHAASGTYDWLIASGPLCPDFCPEVSMAPNGDTIEISGAGTLSLGSRSASGGGSFTHKDSTGEILGSGTWTVERLASFVDFGISPDLVDVLPEGATGGRAVFRIHLSPGGGGPGFDALMTVICDLGSNPAGQGEVVKLAVPGINFNKHVGGGNIFIKE